MSMEKDGHISEIDTVSFFGKFLRGFVLMPYGSRLLTPSAASWMLPMFIVSISMGAIEAMSWHQILNLFAKQRWPGWVSTLLAVTVGVIIWQMDVMFATLDLSRVKKEAGERWAAAGSVDTDLSFLSFLKVYRTDVANRRVASSRVVEPLDVVEHVGTGLLSGSVDLPGNSFCLQ